MRKRPEQQENLYTLTYSGTKIPLKGHERYENCVLGISEDITKRLAIEEHLKTYIKESEVLLSEIHHRVKNNLAVISGLMEIQVLKSDSKETRDKIKDCQARINSIALTHELVYREKKFSEINFGELIKKIAKNVVSTFDQNVTLDFNIEPVILNINQALPSSLFVNEIVTNAMKHAFETAEDPIIEIEMYETDKNVILSISDNGCGFPENFKFAQEKSLGLKLIKIAKDQLNAELKVNSINGVLFELIFKKLTIKGVGSSIDIPLKTGPD